MYVYMWAQCRRVWCSSSSWGMYTRTTCTTWSVCCGAGCWRASTRERRCWGTARCTWRVAKARQPWHDCCCKEVGRPRCTYYIHIHVSWCVFPKPGVNGCVLLQIIFFHIHLFRNQGRTPTWPTTWVRLQYTVCGATGARRAAAAGPGAANDRPPCRCCG